MRKRPEYQREPVELRDTIWSRGYLEPWELLKIAAWKSARGLASLSLNSPAEIINTTGAALTAVTQYKDVTSRDLRSEVLAWTELVQATGEAMGTTTGLRRLHGVRLRMASAVLSILNPELWPVIDRWAAKIVHGLDTAPRVPDTFAYYVDYWQRLADLQLHEGRACTIHDLDQEMYRQGLPPPV